jgi:hypothetical protein
MFRRNILPPSPGLKSKVRKKTAEVGSKKFRKEPAEACRKFQKNKLPSSETSDYLRIITQNTVPFIATAVRSENQNLSQRLRLDSGASEDIRDVTNPSTPPPESRIHVSTEIQWRYSLKPSVVLLPLNYKQTVTRCAFA